MRVGEKLLAREYMHAVIDHRHCGFWWCLRCHWLQATGGHERNRRRTIERMDRISKTLTPVRYAKGADGKWRRRDA